MTIWWWYVDDLMMIWYQGTQKVHQLFYEKIKQASLVCTKIIDTLPTIDHIWLIINQNCFALFSKNLCQQQQHRWEQSVRNELQSANNICKTRSICTPEIFLYRKIWNLANLPQMWNSSCIQSLWSWKSFVSKFALQDRWRKAEKQESWEMFAFSCFGQRIFCSENSFIFFGRKIFIFLLRIHSILAKSERLFFHLQKWWKSDFYSDVVFYYQFSGRSVGWSLVKRRRLLENMVAFIFF